jgi:hypothetical protein
MAVVYLFGEVVLHPLLVPDILQTILNILHVFKIVLLWEVLHLANVIDNLLLKAPALEVLTISTSKTNYLRQFLLDFSYSGSGHCWHARGHRFDASAPASTQSHCLVLSVGFVLNVVA